MRIFQVITVSEYGGAQTIVASLIKHLATEHEVFVLYGGEGEAWNSLECDFKRIRLNKHRKKVSLADILVFFKLIYYRFRYNPDIIHLHSSKMGVLGRLAFSKKKIVYTVHGFDSIRKNYCQYLGIEKQLKNRAASIVGVSEYDVQALKEEGIEKNVTCIYNGVPDFSLQKTKYQDSFLKQIHTIREKHSHIVMCVARISKQKRFDLFLEIAKTLPDYGFIWIGNKEKMENLPANAYCLGEVNDAHTYLEFCDIFILPSNYEGLPMSILEAMCYAKPIVASNVGGIPEILDKGVGFAVENDLNIFAERIRYILENKEVYTEMSQRAREVFLHDHTIQHMADKYLSVYNTIVKNR